MIDSICVVVKRAQGDEKSTLGIRTSYATLMSALETKVLFMEDGVYNLLSGPGYNRSMIERVIHEEGEVYCTAECLKKRGLVREDLLEGVKVIPEGEVSEIIEECESVAVF